MVNAPDDTMTTSFSHDSPRLAAAYDRLSVSENLSFEVGRAEDLGAFGAASFDAVCMSSVFHWVEDRKKALAEARRVLRPGGCVGVTTLPGELRHMGRPANTFAAVLSTPPYRGKVDVSKFAIANAPTTTELVMLVIESGLELVELAVAERSSIHASGDDVVDFLDASSFGNLFRIVSDDMRERFRSDLVAELETHRKPEGVVLRDWGVRFVGRAPAPQA